MDLEGLALHALDTPCDGCGLHAVELAVIREDDPFPAVMRFCRACMADDADDPSLEWVCGEAIS